MKAKTEKAKEIKHVARSGKVWQKIGTEEPLENKIVLKADENISMYKQVPDTKKETKKSNVETGTNGSNFDTYGNKGGLDDGRSN